MTLADLIINTASSLAAIAGLVLLAIWKQAK